MPRPWKPVQMAVKRSSTFLMAFIDLLLNFLFSRSNVATSELLAWPRSFLHPRMNSSMQTSPSPSWSNKLKSSLASEVSNCCVAK
eukprot:Skav217338  [mRNA]  locus=scaffold1410:183957:187267:+ [translate_table: standard]